MGAWGRSWGLVQRTVAVIPGEGYGCTQPVRGRRVAPACGSDHWCGHKGHSTSILSPHQASPIGTPLPDTADHPSSWKHLLHLTFSTAGFLLPSMARHLRLLPWWFFISVSSKGGNAPGSGPQTSLFPQHSLLGDLPVSCCVVMTPTLTFPV